MKPICIAIDGPASAGKSTIAKIIAKHYSYVYLDTGAMYRAVTLAVLEAQLSVEDEAAIVELIENNKIKFKQEADGQHVFWNNKDVTTAIRSKEVTANVSAVSALEQVRKKLVAEQQDYAKEGGIVMDGRDIGTAVLPQAEVKIFLIASVDERAQRRYKENLANGMESNLEEIREAIEKRDYLDSHREISPLVKAKDAIEVDTTGLSIEEVTKKILNIIDDKKIQ